jgi:hypothetical protein
VVHTEGATDVLRDAEAYARDAIADHCRLAEVVTLEAAGYMSGTVLSVWDSQAVAAWESTQSLLARA